MLARFEPTGTGFLFAEMKKSLNSKAEFRKGAVFNLCEILRRIVQIVS